MSAQRREEQQGGKKWTLLRLTVQRIRHRAVARTWGGGKYLKAARVSGKRRWKDDKWARRKPFLFMNFRMTQKCTTLQIEKPFFPMSKNDQILQVSRLKHKEKL
jgi:hypothetical protein